MKYDDALIQWIDHDMGWDDPPEEAPSAIAAKHGYHCKFLDGPFSTTAWIGPDKVWSVCTLIGIRATLLARSFREVERLYRVLRRRQQEFSKDECESRWKEYYHRMWKRRYQKWLCKKPEVCSCQLCRMAKAGTVQ